MPADISRRTFEADKHYAGVVAQQGRVVSDADLNEQLEIAQHRTDTEAVDVIGACGVPKFLDSFRIDLTPDGSDLTVSPGRIYVDGLLCESEAGTLPLTFPAGVSDFEASVPSLQLDSRALDAGQWVEISAAGKPVRVVRITDAETATNTLTFSATVADIHSAASPPLLRRVATYTTQPDYPNPDFEVPSLSPAGFSAVDLPDGYYIAYVLAFRREVNAIEEPHLRETALGGPDTAGRVQTVWQLRLLRVTAQAGKADCQVDFPEWQALTAPSTGQLNARTQTPVDPGNPCVLPPTAGFRSLENQLYRVEVHSGGSRATATFKWSRENASVETGIKVDGNTIIADDIGKDSVLGFAGGQWAEIVDSVSSLNLAPHDLVQLDEIRPATRQITTKQAISGFAGHDGLRLRRWEQGGPTTGVTGVPMPLGWLDLEQGVQVLFSGGTYQSGDYWLVPARTGTGEIEWPPFKIPNTNPVPQAPVGIRRHYCRLAVLRSVAGNITIIDDCREKFPPLTSIAASDVSYDGANCATLVNAATVQDALDLLCQNGRGNCTFIATPGKSVQAIFDAIPTGADAQVCFPIGTYSLDAPVTVNGKGNLKIAGCGPGTRIIGAKSEAALIFSNCLSVTIRDLYAESSTAGTGAALLGSLTVLDTPVVEVRDVTAKCAGGAVRAATCITIRNSTASASSLVRPAVRVANCSLQPGFLQTAVLIVNAARATVEDNDIFAAARPPLLSFDNLVLNHNFRDALAKRLVANPVMGTKPPAGGVTNTQIQFANHTVLFQTHPLLKGEWNALLLPPAQNATAVQVVKALQKTASDALIDPNVRARSVKFQQWFNQVKAGFVSTASQGIVVAGQVASDVRILNNSIQGVLQGIHIGVSHRVPLNTFSADIAGNVRVAGNTIEVSLPPDAIKRERHAIFVGNCNSMSIEDNRARLLRAVGAENIAIDALIAFGFLGKKVLLRHNHITGFHTGIKFEPQFGHGFVMPNPGSVAWLAADNLLETVTVDFQFPPPPNNNPPLVRSGNVLTP
jgi:hypothetical protein